MKKLHKAAITLPAEPRPIILSFWKFTFDSFVHAGFVPLPRRFRQTLASARKSSSGPFQHRTCREQSAYPRLTADADSPQELAKSANVGISGFN
jgi:hypothetical protein